MPVTPTTPDAGPQTRLDALDALRGFAILTMALSGLVPRGKWPAWMYHAQLPPPTHAFDAGQPGLTWVDLVFPFFLFSLGAAIPLALDRRLRRGVSERCLVWHALRRGLLLLGFAIYVQHINPWALSDDPTWITWLRALLGFGLLFPILTRLPAHWPSTVGWALRGAGLLGAVGLCAMLQYADGSGFDPFRSDIIIIVLANVAFYGTLAWLLTRERSVWRLLILLLLVAFRLGHEPAGWVHSLWHLEFLPQAVHPYVMRYAQPYYLQYLHIVLPGTIVGDLLVRRMRAQPEAEAESGRGLATAGGLGLIVSVIVVAGLQARWLPGTPLLALAVCAVGMVVLHFQTSERARWVIQLFGWATAWLAVGLLFEPYEGGIKKDPSTLSYYYVTAGLATFGLLTLMLAQRTLGPRPLAILIDSGQNPMIAYVGIRNLVPPVLALLALLPPVDWLFAQTYAMSEQLFGPTPTGLMHAILLTVLVGLATMGFTHMRIQWRT